MAEPEGAAGDATGPEGTAGDAPARLSARIVPDVSAVPAPAIREAERFHAGFERRLRELRAVPLPFVGAALPGERERWIEREAATGAPDGDPDRPGDDPAR
jgi:hypothetical protein